jgi:hypothetical protein
MRLPFPFDSEHSSVACTVFDGPLSPPVVTIITV